MCVVFSFPWSKWHCLEREGGRKTERQRQRWEEKATEDGVYPPGLLGELNGITHANHALQERHTVGAWSVVTLLLWSTCKTWCFSFPLVFTLARARISQQILSTLLAEHLLWQRGLQRPEGFFSLYGYMHTPWDLVSERCLVDIALPIIRNVVVIYWYWPTYFYIYICPHCERLQQTKKAHKALNPHIWEHDSQTMENAIGMSEGNF